jgi:hypothetical protein
MAENVGVVPLVRMIGLSESTRAKQAEMERIVAEVEAKKSQQEAKDTAESEDAKRYGPASAEALKQQVAAQPTVPETESNARLAQLLKDQEEAARKALEAVKKPEVPPTEEPPSIPELEPLRRVARTEQTPEDVKALSDAGLIEIYKDQPVITEAGLEVLPEAERPRLTPEARKIQIDTGASSVVAEAISKGLRIGVDQVPFDFKMPEGWTIDGDIYVPPAPVVEPPVAPLVEPPVAPTVTPPVEPEVRPVVDAATLNPRGKQANKILTSAGVDPETAAYVAQQYQEEAGEMGAEEWRAFILDKFEENGGVIPAQMRYSEDQEYYEMAFGIGPEEAATLVENAKGQNAQMAQAELEQNKQWRRKDEQQITEAQQGVAVAQPETQAVPLPAGEVPPSPAIEGRRVPLAAPEAPPVAGAVTEEQANQVVKDAQEARAKGKPVDVPIEDGEAKSLAPKDTLDRSVRDALISVSRLNLSKIAQSNPNEIMMQDVAAILAKLNMPLLDKEQVKSLASQGKRGRAQRFRGGPILMPSSVRETVETFVHEVGHTLTGDQIDLYAPRKTIGRGKPYLDALNKVIADPNTPEPISRLFSLYISTIEQLGITEQYFGAKGIAGTPDADTSAAMAKRRQATGALRKDLDYGTRYGLANVSEFVSQTFSEQSFRDLLKTLKDPTNPKKTLWSAFVEAIQRILQLPKGSMAAAVIEVSVDIGMTVPAKKGRGRAAPSPVSETNMAPEGEPEEGAQTIQMQFESNDERLQQIFARRMYDADLPDIVNKETVQNSFDAIKDAEEMGEIPAGEGLILYSQKDIKVDGQDRVRVTFIDNGAGMTPEILQNAFFTVGGTFKRSKKASGGFGIAKLGMFMSAEKVYVETVRDGVVTSADVDKKFFSSSQGKKQSFPVEITKDPSRKNGTMVVLDFEKTFGYFIKLFELSRVSTQCIKNSNRGWSLTEMFEGFY